MALLGLLLDSLDIISVSLGDPDLKQNISDALGGNAQWLGRILVGISIITLLTRLRSLRKKPDA